MANKKITELDPILSGSIDITTDVIPLVDVSGDKTDKITISELKGAMLKGTGAASTLGNGVNNTTSGAYSTVSGGGSNTASGNSSTIGGGLNNEALHECSTVGGGGSNTASGYVSTIGGGKDNTTSGYFSTIGGGKDNTASGNSSTIGGGGSNTASGYFSTILGGQSNCVSHDKSFIIGSNLTSTATCYTFVNNLCNIGGGTSDCRLKENINNIPYGLCEVKQLEPVSYAFKNDESKKTKYGFLAQCVQEIMPELISNHPTDTVDGDPVLQFDKEAVWASLVNAIKEQQVQIENLEQRIQNLEN